MPTYDDFDTVCYSKQHNIIQLIKYQVEMSDAISALQGQVNGMQSSVGDLADSVNDLAGLSGTILENVSDLAGIVQTLADLVANHEQRIRALEGS